MSGTSKADREKAVEEAVLVALKKIGIEVIRSKPFFGTNEKIPDGE